KNYFIIYLNRFYSRVIAEYFPLKSTYKGKKLSKNKITEIIEDYQTKIKEAKNQEDLEKCISKKVNKNTFLENISLIQNYQNLANIPIQTIKDMIEKMNLSVSEGRRKVFIFNGIELMRNEGSNAFLKSIEEPPKNTQIILISSNINKILQTIKSRCYQIEFRKRHIEDLIQVYSKIYKTDLNSLQNEKLNNIFRYHPEILYKKHFISLFELMYNIVVNKDKKYTILNMITEYADSINIQIKNEGSKKDLHILRQAINDFLSIIKMIKKSYDFQTYIDTYLMFLTNEEKNQIIAKSKIIFEYFKKYSNSTINEIQPQIHKAFDYILYNNVELDMTLTQCLLNVISI
ncbi:MAG: hypothetical protein ACOCV8_02880, partial [Spirochaetota bacterium]